MYDVREVIGLRASLMVTCLGDALYPEVGESVMAVLRNLGVTLDFPAGQTCCGQPAFNSGYVDDARRSARAFIDAFEGSEHVVSISGSCAAMVRQHYPLLFPAGRERARAESLAARTWEFSQFLTDVLGVERLPVTYRAVATLHHSCHTMRLLGVREGPERLLGMVDGLEYRPLARAEDCCGFGGTFAVKMAAISGEMVDRKASHVLETGRRPARGPGHELPDEHRRPPAAPRGPGRRQASGAGAGRGLAGRR